MDKNETHSEANRSNPDSIPKHFKKKSEINNLFKEYYKEILELPSKEYELLIKVISNHISDQH
jgi:hypothetical protein